MTRAPALFVSHGSPMFAVEPGRLGPQLGELGRQLRGLRAVLVVSPHWQTLSAAKVLATTRPETIHDFRGFPPELYGLRYPIDGTGARRRGGAAARFLPLLVAQDAADGDVPAQHVAGGLTYGTLSMDSYAWGLSQSATQ